MKKITTILMLLMLTCMGAKAGEVTNRASAGSPMTYNDFVALAGTGKHFALMATSSNATTYPKWFSFSKAGYPETLTTVQLFELENTTDAGWYNIKRVSDGLYVSAEGGSFDATTKLPFKLDNRKAGDYHSEFDNKDLHISFDNAAGKHFNANPVNVNFQGGTGGYSTYVAFGPFYLVTINCVDEAGDPIPGQAPIVKIVTDGTTVDNIEAPEIAGYAAQAGYTTSVTVDGADEVVNITYAEATTVNITYQIVDADGNPIYTFPAVAVNAGTAITALPSEYQHTWFYDYAAVSETADADKTVQVTATPKMFVPFTNFADATWYYVTLRGNKYVRVTSNEPYDTSNTNEETDAYQWAFSGNPYTGVKMYNKTTGASKTVTKDGNNPVLRDGEYTWEILPNLDGFVLKAPGTANWYINNSNGQAKFGYWDSTAGRTDNGGTFRLTKVPNMSELLQAAHDLYDALNEGRQNVQIGYPTESALADFLQAITDAESITDIEALKTALNTATAAVKSPANTNYTPRTDVYYTLTNANVPSGNRGSMVYDPSKDNETDGDGNNFLWFTTSLDKNDANHQWGFIEKDGKYFMYNVGKRQFAGVTTKAGTNTPFYSAGTWMFSNHPSSVTLDAGESNWVATPNVRVQATSEVTGNTYAMSISTSYHGPVITYDAVNDGGIPMAFAVATETQDQAVTTAIEALLEDLQPYRDALQEAINNANAMIANVGEGLNKYTVTSGMEALNQALTDGQAEYLKPDTETNKTALVAAREAIETALANLVKTLNMPQAGFYRIKGNTSGKYVSNGGGKGAKYTMVETADETTIFCYDGEKLINYKTGLCFNLPSWTWAYGNESVATTFLDGLSNGGYAIQNGETGNGKVHLYDNGSSCDRGGFDPATMSTQNTRYREWYLEEVTELPITLRSTDNETYFATFSAPVNVQIIGASLNNVQKDGNTATFTAVDTDMLKAGVGVLLSGTSASATATVITDEVADENYGLVGYYAATAGTGDETKFYLGKGKTSGKAGFYKLGVGTTSNGFKAYLSNSTEFGGAKEGLELEFAGVTGIDNMENGTLNMENGAVYNLQGQRVNKAQKGVFIQNGKKVVLK